jgi:hypothetical protein
MKTFLYMCKKNQAFYILLTFKKKQIEILINNTEYTIYTRIRFGE